VVAPVAPVLDIEVVVPAMPPDPTETIQPLLVKMVAVILVMVVVVEQEQAAPWVEMQVIGAVPAQVIRAVLLMCTAKQVSMVLA
jgi:hypothetical protein